MNRFRQTPSTPFRTQSNVTKRSTSFGLSLLCWTLLWGILFLPVSHAAGPLLPKRQVPKRPVTKKNNFTLSPQLGTSEDSRNYTISRDSLIQQVTFNEESSHEATPRSFDLDLQGIFNDLDTDNNSETYIEENEEQWDENDDTQQEAGLSQSFVEVQPRNAQNPQDAQVALAAGALPTTTFAQPPKRPVRTSGSDEEDDVDDSPPSDQTPGLSPDNPYALMYPDSVSKNSPQNTPFSPHVAQPFGPLSLNSSAMGVGVPNYSNFQGGSAVSSPYGFSAMGVNPQNGYAMSPYNQTAYNQAAYNQASAYQMAGYYYPYTNAGYMGAGPYSAYPAYTQAGFHRFRQYDDDEYDDEDEIEVDKGYYSLTQTMFESLCYFNPLNLPKGPNRGVGGPMVMRSWKDRPLYVGFFGGVMFGDELISRLVDQGDGGSGGLTFGWYCDDYWGIESRLHFSGLPGKDTAYGRQKFEEWYKESYGGDYVPPTSSRNNALTVFDVSVHYYPFGNSKWRPYLKLGVGLVNQSFRDVYGYKRDYNSIAVPVGIGVKYWWNERVSIHMELVDNIVTSTEIVDTQNNLALTFGLNFPIGRVKRREPVVYWPYTPSAK